MAESSNDILRLTWTQFLPQLPIYLIWLIGMFLALTRRQQQPIPALLALVAFGLFLASALVGTFLAIWVLSRVENSDVERAWMFSFIALGRTVVGTGAWILLLLALFGWRTSSLPRQLPREADLDDAQPAVPDTGIRKGRSG